MVVQVLVTASLALLQGAAEAAAWIASRPFHTTAMGIFLGALIVTYFNAPLLFVDPERATEMMSIYLLFIALALAGGPGLNPLYGVTAFNFIAFGALGVALGGVVFSVLQPINPDVSPVVEGTWFGFVVIGAFVIAMGEEIFFRGVLARLLGGGMGGQFLAALVFAAAHVWAYSLQAGSPAELVKALVFVFLLGLAFGALTETLPEVGFVLAVAAHFAWNLYTYGILGA